MGSRGDFGYCWGAGGGRGNWKAANNNCSCLSRGPKNRSNFCVLPLKTGKGMRLILFPAGGWSLRGGGGVALEGSERELGKLSAISRSVSLSLFFLASLSIIRGHRLSLLKCSNVRVVETVLRLAGCTGFHNSDYNLPLGLRPSDLSASLGVHGFSGPALVCHLSFSPWSVSMQFALQPFFSCWGRHPQHSHPFLIFPAPAS